MGFGKEIKRLREEAKISVQKLSDMIGLDNGGADRWRLWERKDFSPKDEDTRLIEAFFKMSIKEIERLQSIKKFLNVPHGNQLGEPNIPYGLSHTEKLIRVLEERMTEEKRILEKHNDFLQDIVKTNLTGLATGQRLIRAQVRAIHQWDAHMAAKGDRKKEDALLKQMGKRINDNFLESHEGDSIAENGK